MVQSVYIRTLVTPRGGTLTLLLASSIYTAAIQQLKHVGQDVLKLTPLRIVIYRAW